MEKPSESMLREMEASLRGKGPVEGLSWIASRFPQTSALSNGFGKEGMILTDMICRLNLEIRVFTIDTGRLYNETYTLYQQTLEKYGRPVEVYFPNPSDIEQFVIEKGPNCFYQSRENRILCCHHRKVRPLERALKGMDVWITGLRAGQSDHRRNFKMLSWDEGKQILKYNPILYWDGPQVDEYIRIHQVPCNALHDKGYQSIGCSPCTRPTEKGEDERSGRWWWEDSKKECGLHENYFAEINARKATPA